LPARAKKYIGNEATLRRTIETGKATSETHGALRCTLFPSVPETKIRSEERRIGNLYIMGMHNHVLKTPFQYVYSMVTSLSFYQHDNLSIADARHACPCGQISATGQPRGGQIEVWQRIHNTGVIVAAVL
jgi:hypothetical protein